jgi:serine/threonine protein kinase
VHREIALMRLFNHPHLLKLVEVCESANHLYIVLEYAAHGELFDYLVSSQSLSVDVAMGFFRQIIFGLGFLHSHAICHRDLKPENILLDEFDNIKIGDFGFARWMKSNIVDTSCGSPHYAAPEVIRGIPYDGRAADIWSCGVILFALLSGRLPFFDPAIRNLLAKVKAGQYVMPDFPPDIQSLVSRMLTVDPDQRIKIDQIKSHPTFRIGVFIPTYVFPSPLPVPDLSVPIDLATVHPDAIGILRQIGFADDELSAAFAMSGNSWAKVFHHMLTSQVALDLLPWTDGERPADEDASFIVSPDAPERFNSTSPSPDPFSRTSHTRRGPSSGCYSLVERAQWAAFAAHEFKNDLMQPCVQIGLPVDVLMAKMQLVLGRLNLQWFHPDDLTIIARLPDQPVYIQVKVDFEAVDSLKMDLYFTQATPTMVQLITDSVRAVLAGE